MNAKSSGRVQKLPVKIGIILPPSMRLEFEPVKTAEEILQTLTDKTTNLSNRIDRNIRGKVEGNSFYFSTSWVDPNLPDTVDSRVEAFARAAAGPLMRSSAEGQGYATLRGTIEATEAGTKISAELEVTSGLLVKYYVVLALIGAVVAWAFYPAISNPIGNAGMLLSIPLVLGVLIVPLFLLYKIRSQPKSLIGIVQKCI